MRKLYTFVLAEPREIFSVEQVDPFLPSGVGKITKSFLQQCLVQLGKAPPPKRKATSRTSTAAKRNRTEAPHADTASGEDGAIRFSDQASTATLPMPPHAPTFGEALALCQARFQTLRSTAHPPATPAVHPVLEANVFIDRLGCQQPPPPPPPPPPSPNSERLRDVVILSKEEITRRVIAAAWSVCPLDIIDHVLLPYINGKPTWSCPCCTYDNDDSSNTCFMCTRVRLSSVRCTTCCSVIPRPVCPACGVEIQLHWSGL